MKKLAVLAAFVLAAAVSFAMAGVAAGQVTVTTSLMGPPVVMVGEEASWDITIEVAADSNVTDVIVKDGMGADLDEIIIGIPTHGSATSAKRGKGKMGATMITWEIGDLMAGETASIVVTVTTGLNPKDKHEFTSPELGHELDGGASASYRLGDIEYETLETLPLTVDVIE